MKRAGVLLVFLLGGCGPHMATPTEMAAACDLVVMAELQGEEPQQKLVAIEVLKGHLGTGIGYRLGDVIEPVFGSLAHHAGSERRLLLFYQKRFGSESWLMACTASGENAALVDELRKNRANQPPQPNAGNRPSSGDSPASETPSSLGPRG